MGQDDFANYEKNSDITSSSKEESRSLVAESLHAAAYAAIQMPLDAVAQVAHHLTGSNALKVNLVDAPQFAEPGTDRWTAQIFGAGMGTAPLVMALHAASRGVVGKVAGGAAIDTLGRSVATGMMTGSLYQGVFQPVQEGDNFWTQKFGNAMTGAVVFGSMSAVGKGLESFGRRSLARDSFVARAFEPNNLARASMFSSAAMFTPINFDSAIREDARHL